MKTLKGLLEHDFERMGVNPDTDIRIEILQPNGYRFSLSCRKKRLDAIIGIFNKTRRFDCSRAVKACYMNPTSDDPKDLVVLYNMDVQAIADNQIPDPVRLLKILEKISEKDKSYTSRIRVVYGADKLDTFFIQNKAKLSNLIENIGKARRIRINDSEDRDFVYQ